MRSKVIFIGETKYFENSKFLKYKTDIRFENNDAGVYWHKEEKQSVFMLNNEADYIIENKSGYMNIKVPTVESVKTDAVLNVLTEINNSLKLIADAIKTRQ